VNKWLKNRGRGSEIQRGRGRGRGRGSKSPRIRGQKKGKEANFAQF
jgi:hypothetical protein